MEKLSSKITATNFKELKNRGYYIENEIGHGTYSHVYKAEKFENLKNKNKNNNSNPNSENPATTTTTFTKTKYVAIKIINHRQSAENFCQKFLPREIDVVRSITHKNIVETIEILMSPDSATYIVTEYCMRGDLLNYICLRGALSEKQSKSYFYDLISAVEYLHDIDVVHRDIKCENLLVHSNYNDNDNPNNCSTMLKLADFGFSREIFENQLSTTFCGSPAYVAPEIITGKPYNPRLTDIWSCGVVLYIMVNASMPFDDENLNELLKQQMSSLKRRTDNEISDDLYFFIEGLLTVNVRNRLNLKTIKNAVWYGNVNNEKNNNQLATS